MKILLEVLIISPGVNFLLVRNAYLRIFLKQGIQFSMLSSKVAIFIILFFELRALFSDFLNLCKDKFFAIIVRDILQTGTNSIRQRVKLSLDI